VDYDEIERNLRDVKPETTHNLLNMLVVDKSQLIEDIVLFGIVLEKDIDVKALDDLTVLLLLAYHDFKQNDKSYTYTFITLIHTRTRCVNFLRNRSDVFVLLKPLSSTQFLMTIMNVYVPGYAAITTMKSTIIKNKKVKGKIMDYDEIKKRLGDVQPETTVDVMHLLGIKKAQVFEDTMLLLEVLFGEAKVEDGRLDLIALLLTAYDDYMCNTVLNSYTYIFVNLLRNTDACKDGFNLYGYTKPLVTRLNLSEFIKAVTGIYPVKDKFPYVYKSINPNRRVGKIITPDLEARIKDEEKQMLNDACVQTPCRHQDKVINIEEVTAPIIDDTIQGTSPLYPTIIYATDTRVIKLIHKKYMVVDVTSRTPVVNLCADKLPILFMERETTHSTMFRRINGIMVYKTDVYRNLRKFGITIPQTYIIYDVEVQIGSLKDIFKDRPVLVKPIHGANQEGVMVLTMEQIYNLTTVVHETEPAEFLEMMKSYGNVSGNAEDVHNSWLNDVILFQEVIEYVSEYRVLYFKDEAGSSMIIQQRFGYVGQDHEVKSKKIVDHIGHAKDDDAYITEEVLSKLREFGDASDLPWIGFDIYVMSDHSWGCFEYSPGFGIDYPMAEYIAIGNKITATMDRYVEGDLQHLMK